MTIPEVIDQALTYIQSQQQSDGSFLDDNITPSIFYTGLIAATLTDNQHSICHAITDKAVDFLLSQDNGHFSWNYWKTGSNSPYPDDMDDTCVALQAITLHRPNILNEKVWTAVTRLLMENETQPGGPYHTWIMESSLRHAAWQDTDIVVNSNIAIFLQYHHITLLPLQSYFETAICNDTLQSLYYEQEYVVIYFLCKAYTGQYRSILRNKILSRKNAQGYWDTPLENAYAITSLLRLEGKPEIVQKAVQHLMQSHDWGRWQSSPLFIDQRCGKDNIHSSCRAYVSACCLEALTLYSQAISPAKKCGDEKEQQFVSNVIALCKSQFSNLSHDIQKQVAFLLEALLQKDPQKEVFLLSFRFASKLSTAMDEETVFSLAVANALGWIGYSIKDAIQDGEQKILFLSTAILCIRKSIQLFHTGATDYFSISDIEKVLDDIEISMVWEHTHCSFQNNYYEIPAYDNYEMLAQKSFGHALGPLILSSVCQDTTQIDYVRTFFEHYLIARQMNDDAHDWPDDLHNSMVNSISNLFISSQNYQQPIELLQELFWEKHIDTACTLIMQHIAEARTAIQNITILSDSDVLENLLIPLEQSCTIAIEERDKTKRLLELMQ